MEKACSKCGTVKPLDEFYFRSDKKHLRVSRCKSCVRASSKGNRKPYDPSRVDSAKRRVQNRDYYLRNSEKVKDLTKSYKARKRASDPAFRLESNMRCRFTNAFSGNRKTSSVWALVGKDRDSLMDHLETMFTEGMTRDNYGEWHVDHIRPVSSFSDPADPACWHWSNLQPLWAKDNLSKGARV